MKNQFAWEVVSKLAPILAGHFLLTADFHVISVLLQKLKSVCTFDRNKCFLLVCFKIRTDRHCFGAVDGGCRKHRAGLHIPDHSTVKLYNIESNYNVYFGRKNWKLHVHDGKM